MPRTSAIALLALAACNPYGLRPVEFNALDSYTGEDPAIPSDDVFVRAERETGVPAELLAAISVAETGLQMVAGEEEFPGQPKGHGLMGLRDGNLEVGAELAGVTADAARTDRTANVLAAAQLMAAWAYDLGVDFDDLDAWAPVVAQYSGIADPVAADQYVYDEVYAALDAGIEAEGLHIPPRLGGTARPARPVVDDAAPASRTGDGGAIWSGSPNYNSRSGAGVDFVIIHTCEGSYSGCWSWLTNSASGVSAHYVVNDAGTEVRQLVDENDRAWHISTSYDSDLNSGVDSWRDGTSMNTISVGIEHAGYASQSSWNAGLIQRSAELACGITDRHGIPRDAYHVVGHGQLQPYNRIDPGPNWPWTDYLNRIKAACGDTASSAPPSSSSGGTAAPPAPSGTAPTFLIDSNDAANDLSVTDMDPGAGWWASTNVAGYYNTGYWVADTAPTSDPASFWFLTEAETCYTVEAWWTSAWDRYPSATFIGWDEGYGEVGRAVVDQTTSGGRWNVLGDWTFPAGWNQVALSRWAPEGFFVVADAVRLTPCTGP
jgi:hypothetical protein